MIVAITSSATYLHLLVLVVDWGMVHLRTGAKDLTRSGEYPTSFGDFVADEHIKVATAVLTGMTVG